MLKKLPIFRTVYKSISDSTARDNWIKVQLEGIPEGSKILDAGCGSQQYKKYCGHLQYFGQDFGKYTQDQNPNFMTSKSEQGANYEYGHLDYESDITCIPEVDQSFDVILCTEVFEHIPDPQLALHEFSRLLRPNGTLLLTAPGACLRHFDPYFFYSGFSDRWYEYQLPKYNFTDISIEPIGDYYSWIAFEIARTGLGNGVIAKALLAPAFLYFFTRRKNKISIDTLCMGYHVRARKLDDGK